MENILIKLLECFTSKTDKCPIIKRPRLEQLHAFLFYIGIENTSIASLKIMNSKCLCMNFTEKYFFFPHDFNVKF